MGFGKRPLVGYNEKNSDKYSGGSRLYPNSRTDAELDLERHDMLPTRLKRRVSYNLFRKSRGFRETLTDTFNALSF